MTQLHALQARPGSASASSWLAALRAALEGTGPALLPLPAEPAGVAASLIESFRPDDAATPLAPPGVALVVPTSGSTGEPKGAQLTGDAIRASAAATHARLGGPGRWVLALPLTHVAGLMVLARSIEAGTSPTVVDLADGFEPAAFAAALTEATGPGSAPLYSALVPTQLTRLLDAGVDLAPLDGILLGGAGAPVELLERAAAAGATVLTTYGMSETSGGCVYDGWPLEGVAVSVGDDGRVRIAGPTLFSGYRLRPDLTAAVVDDHGRLVTQDLGRISPDGQLSILGRADDVVISGGVNVPVAQVALVLAGHPAVQACAVAGRPDEQWGERVVAVVVPTDPASPPSLEMLRAHAAGQLEAAALPTRLVLTDHLPLLPSGKPDRDAVRVLASTQEP